MNRHSTVVAAAYFRLATVGLEYSASSVMKT
jgi:hypothetical protein